MIILRIFAGQRFSTFIPNVLESAGSCILPKGVVRVSGDDAAKFLNGMCTGDVLAWSTEPKFRGAYCCFLAPTVTSFLSVKELNVVLGTIDV